MKYIEYDEGLVDFLFSFHSVEECFSLINFVPGFTYSRSVLTR